MMRIFTLFRAVFFGRWILRLFQPRSYRALGGRLMLVAIVVAFIIFQVSNMTR